MCSPPQIAFYWGKNKGRLCQPTWVTSMTFPAIMFCLLVSYLPDWVEEHCTARGRGKPSPVPSKGRPWGLRKHCSLVVSAVLWLIRSWKSDLKPGGSCTLWAHDKLCGFWWDMLQPLTRFFKVRGTGFSKLSPGKVSLEETSCNHRLMTKAV